MREIAILMAASACITGCSGEPVERIRYRIDIVVATPLGDRISSGVLGIYGQDFRSLEGSGKNTRTLMHGSAIPIDVPGKPAIWMTIGHRGFDWPSRAPWNDRRMDPGKKVVMDERMVPPFVTFTNEKDPSTARLVPISDFSRILGPGYVLKAIYVSTTKNEKSDYTLQRIPWARTMIGQLDGKTRNFIDTGSEDITEYMGSNYFYRESM